MRFSSWLRSHDAGPPPGRVERIHRTAPGRASTRRLSAEGLEGRWVPSTFTVLNTDDTGAGSLRQAILDANANPGADLIAFNIPGPGVQTIAVGSTPLPDITDPVTIDGYTQPGTSANTLAVGDNAILLIEVDGETAGNGVNGLHITAGNSTVQGLMIDNFLYSLDFTVGGNAILLESNGGNVIQGNWLGLHGSANRFARSNEDCCVFVSSGSAANLIGGLTPASRNVLSGSGGGVALVGATTNLVEGNYIGTDPTGAVPVGNLDGVYDSGVGNTIGGTVPGAGNVISGNIRFGIYGGVAGATQGNFIGTDPTGTALVSNGSAGIFAPTGELIGGTAAGSRNVITGNSGIGIWMVGGSGNLVQGNFIGTDVTGNAPLGNPSEGIVLESTTNSIIGGTAPGAGNVVSNCFYANVYLFDSAAGNTVEGNLIGTDATGAVALGYNGIGVLVGQVGYGTSNNTIGGPAPGAGNLIAFSTGAGVAVVDAASTGNSVRGNSIHDNAGLGVDLDNDGVTLNDRRDFDAGPNRLQNFPVLINAVAKGNGTTHVNGRLNSTANSAFDLDFYADSTADPSGHGEGRRYLGSATVTTGARGHVHFNVVLGAATAAGEVVSATATDPTGNTSEFSRIRPVVGRRGGGGTARVARAESIGNLPVPTEVPARIVGPREDLLAARFAAESPVPAATSSESRADGSTPKPETSPAPVAGGLANLAAAGEAFALADWLAERFPGDLLMAWPG